MGLLRKLLRRGFYAAAAVSTLLLLATLILWPVSYHKWPSMESGTFRVVITAMHGRRRLARAVGLCGKCHYDLRAHALGENCPECGTAKKG